MKVLLIVPAYNEEKNILKTCNTIKEFSSDLDYVVINDGSKDDTLKILKENNLNYVSLIDNLGIGGAVQTGYKYAYEHGYDIAIQFDGDGQHDINFVPNICEDIVLGNCDMVIGSRYLDKKSSLFKSTLMRRIGSKIISFFIRITCFKKITDSTSGFRAVNRKIIEEFKEDYPIDYPEPQSTVSLLKKGYKVKEVPVSMNERQGGKSSIRLFKTIDYMVKVCLAIVIQSVNINKRRVK